VTVSTTLGPIAADAIGPTLMHEHVFTLYSDLSIDYPRDDDAMDAAAIEQLSLLRLTGFRTIVDLTVFGLGRDVRRMARLSAESGVNIIPATGIYTFSDLPSRFGNGARLVSDDYIADFLEREIVHGIGETGIHPAVLKVATDRRGVTEDVGILLRQTAIAHVRTGTPISTHTHAASEQGLAQLAIFRELGVDLTRVVIGHSGDSTDLDYLRRIADTGAFLGMDRFGHRPSGSLESQIQTVVSMCELGYAGSMVLSHDTNVATDNIPPEAKALPIYDGWDYQLIPTRVLPALRERGVSEADLRRMTVENPIAILDR
jgi:phosphotriesterase-related protein